MWHISNNAKQHLASCFANAEFKAQFNKCFYGCESETEFELSWATMFENFELQDHAWLKRLYELRIKWCPAFSKDILSAQTRSTQRSESMNNILHQIMNCSLSLIQVIQHYEEKAKEFRQIELNQDFRCKNGAPNKVNGRGILKHASDVYTLAMFKRFEEELMDCIGLNCVEASNIENLCLYHVTEDGRERIYCVELDVSNSIVSCSCNMFGSLGLLCRHALRVLLMNNIKEIPEKYILRRWTKKAKSLLASDFRASSTHEEKSSCLLRLSELNHIGYNLFEKGSLTPKCTQIVKEKLFEALQLVEKEMTTMQEAKDSKISKHISFEDAINDDNGRSSEKLMFDPVCVKTKGSRNSRMKSQFEKNQKKQTNKAMNFQVSKDKEKISRKQNKSHMHEGSPLVSLPMESQTHVYPSYHQTPMLMTPNYQNHFFHPLQDFSSNWRFNSSSNISYTKLQGENDPSLFKTQEHFSNGLESQKD